MAKIRMEGKRIKLMKNTDDKEITEAVESGWGYLDYDLLQQILKLLPVKDLIGSISLVCRHWNLGCLTVLFCKDYQTLDLSPLKTLLNYPYINYKELHRALRFVLNWDLKTMESITSVIFPPCMCLIGSHLALVAKRLPKLKKLVLPESNNITLKGFLRIIKTWKQLDELSIRPLGHSYSDRFFPALGKSCKNLTTLHIFGSLARFSFSLDKQKASIIAQNLPKLRVLTIDETNLHKSGVWTILSESKNLLELNLNRCRGKLDSPVSSPMPTQKLIHLKKEISMEIKSCKLKNCLKWYIASSLADHTIRYTTTLELVNHLWAGDVVEIELNILTGYHWGNR